MIQEWETFLRSGAKRALFRAGFGGGGAEGLGKLPGMLEEKTISSGALRDHALGVVRRLQAGGHEAFWVGGCVRDQLLGKEPHDYDIATSARPPEVEKLFPHTVPVGRQFGVVVVVEGGHNLQVATFRAEADYEDGRHPSRVSFANAQADAVRRDFTVNGLFLDPVTGQLHDWVGGRADLAARVVRAIGNPRERFAEDHLRMLRAVRFAAQLGFTVDAGTLGAIRENVAAIRTVSAERIRDELLKLFRPPHAGRGLELLRESGLLAEVLPEIAATEGCEQSPTYHPEGHVFRHITLLLEHLPADAAPGLPWAALLHDVGKPATAERDPATGQIHFYGHEKVGAEMSEVILQRLRFPRRQIEEIVTCVRLHMQFKDVRQMRRSTLNRLLLRPTFRLELELHRLDCLASNGDLSNHRFLVEQEAELGRKPPLRPPLLTGADLKGLGLTEGPALGALLAEIREKQLLEEITTAEAAREFARRRIAGG